MPVHQMTEYPFLACEDIMVSLDYAGLAREQVTPIEIAVVEHEVRVAGVAAGNAAGTYALVEPRPAAVGTRTLIGAGLASAAAVLDSPVKPEKVGRVMANSSG
jgi:hypothetical protein